MEPITWDGEKGTAREIFSLQIKKQLFGLLVIIYRDNVIETVENSYGLKPVLLDHVYLIMGERSGRMYTCID